MTAPEPGRGGLRDIVMNAALGGAIRIALMIPYRARVRAFGWLTSRVIAPLAGHPQRIRANLAHAWPDLPESEVRRLCRDVPDNIGRTMIEIYSGEAFSRHIAATVTPRGPGMAALDAAQQAGRPVILVSGHFGNYDAVRVIVARRGYRIGGLYRPLNNPLFNAHYLRAMERIATPVFPRGRRGLAQMVKFLRAGNTIALLVDQYYNGTVLEFFGKPAPSAISAAEMALKYDALLVPTYAIRQPDGLSFDVVVEEPVPPSDPVTMMQAVADSLEARVRAHPGQWLWVHRRWKPELAGRDVRAETDAPC
ncbi:KDO2-lipid IV(A) lauroyltransferase [Salinihabitans flavidus]|uniref:KDO2-lipid IV(A) lauroyltransferase n=1 Tax=Salinihabitans flavidus TaxID=569882 RepID=A0A1H8RMY1_9RHOB|nr:lysophospholipid acyltransferase family protein [Salinihabitans flavidus]SEO67909.1 KDO2-lipid IV(A) lauroyltransferase [Salinihabitans flavidus]